MMTPTADVEAEDGGTDWGLAMECLKRIALNADEL